MDSLPLLSIILVCLGTGFMFASFIASMKTNRGVPESLRARWLTMTYLMFFFLIGYIAFLTIQIRNLSFPLELLTSIVFLGGAVFVFLVVNVTRETITRIAESKDHINKANETLVKKNLELKEEVKARLQAEKELQQAHEGLEIRIEERTAELTKTLEKLQHEVSERKRAEEALKDSHAELDQIFNTAADAMIVVDRHFQITRANDTFVKMVGLKGNEPVGKKCFEVFAGPHCHSSDCALARILNGENKVEREAEKKRPDGRNIACIVTATPHRDPSGKVIGIIEDFKDITARKELEEKLHTLSITDELTGLCNRRGFLATANQQILLAERIKEKFFLLYVDIDNMKWINDNLGHAIGDQALIETAEILKNTFRKTDVIGVGRLGGDEFAVLLASAPDVTVEHPVLARLEEKLNTVNQQKGRLYSLKLSSGIAQYDPENPCTIEEMISKADSLMYKSKKEKKANHS